MMNPIYINLACIVLSAYIAGAFRKNPIAFYVNIFAVVVNVGVVAYRLTAVAQ